MRLSEWIVLCACTLSSLANAQSLESACPARDQIINNSRSYIRERSQRYLDAYDYEIQVAWIRYPHFPWQSGDAKAFLTFEKPGTHNPPESIKLQLGSAKFAGLEEEIDFSKSARIKIEPKHFSFYSNEMPHLSDMTLYIDQTDERIGSKDIPLTGGFMQPARESFFGTRYVKNLAIENNPNAFPLFVETGVNHVGLAGAGLDSHGQTGVVVVYRNPKQPDWFKTHETSLAVGQRVVIIPYEQEVVISRLSLESGVVWVKNEINHEYTVDVLDVAPIIPVEKVGPWFVGQRVRDIGNGFIPSKITTIKELSATGMIKTEQRTFRDARFFRPVQDEQASCEMDGFRN